MPLRILLRYLSQNEHLIQKLADSPAMKRAAQLTAYWIYRGREIGESKAEQIKQSGPFRNLENETKDKSKRLQSFSETFLKELKDGFDEMNRQKRR